MDENPNQSNDSADRRESLLVGRLRERAYDAGLCHTDMTTAADLIASQERIIDELRAEMDRLDGTDTGIDPSIVEDLLDLAALLDTLAYVHRSSHVRRAVSVINTLRRELQEAWSELHPDAADDGDERDGEQTDPDPVAFEFSVLADQAIPDAVTIPSDLISLARHIYEQTAGVVITIVVPYSTNGRLAFGEGISIELTTSDLGLPYLRIERT